MAFRELVRVVTSAMNLCAAYTLSVRARMRPATTIRHAALAETSRRRYERIIGSYAERRP